MGTRFRVLHAGDYQWELLIDADPSRDRVAEYLADGVCVGLFHRSELIGEYVLVDRESGEGEIMNLAVAPARRNRTRFLPAQLCGSRLRERHTVPRSGSTEDGVAASSLPLSPRSAYSLLVRGAACRT